MPTSYTVTEVKNRALDMIAEYPIEGPGDTGIYARWLNRNFTPTVEAALRQQPWNFACRFYIPQEDQAKPIMRWRYGYGLPNGWLRVLQPTYNGLREGRPIHYAVQGNTLMTNERIPKGVELVMNIQEPGQWDPLFADLIAARLATAMAHRFTAKNSFVDRCKVLADEAYEQAELINAFEGSMPVFETFDIIRARSEDDWRGEY